VAMRVVHWRARTSAWVACHTSQRDQEGPSFFSNSRQYRDLFVYLIMESACKAQAGTTDESFFLKDRG